MNQYKNSDNGYCNLSSKCNFGNSSTNYSRFYGEATKEGEYTVITWNDGKKDYLVSTDDFYVGFNRFDGGYVPYYNRVKIEYPNGRSLEIVENGIEIKQDGKLLGTINADMDDYYSYTLSEPYIGEICINLQNGASLWIREGKEYDVSGQWFDTERNCFGTYEGGSLVDISLSNEERGFEDGVFEIITGVEKEKEAARPSMSEYRAKQKVYQNRLNVKQKALKNRLF